MWRNPSNNYEEYFREDRGRENTRWSSQTPMESFNQPPHESEVYHPLPYSQYQHEEMEYEWNHQHHYEPSNEEMEYRWNHEYPQELSNEEIGYMENYQCQQESYNSNLYYYDSSVENQQEYENPGIASMLQQLLEGQRRQEIREEEAFEEMEKNMDRTFKEVSERLDGLTLYFDSLKAQVEIQETSNNEYMVQLQSLYEDEEESIQFQKDELSEEVQDAQLPPEEEIEMVPKNAEMTPESEVMVFFPTIHEIVVDEIVVEHQDDQIYTQQQSPAGEEVVEIIQLHEDALDEDALALIVAVMNEETLRYNKASIEFETNKEENEVFQLYELPQKEPYEDEVVEPRVPGSPTPRLQHPQGLRKRLEWRIKHKWKIKLHNV